MSEENPIVPGNMDVWGEQKNPFAGAGLLDMR